VLVALRQAYGLTGIQSTDGERPNSMRLEPAPEQSGSHNPGMQEKVKVIGNLRVDISAFNTYLNETDEWSRCLVVELSEWALELHRTLAPSTLAWTHALAESSASVGLKDLSTLADALERALRHVQAYAPAQPQHVKVFMEAADDIRRLLHQFAAGFLKQPEPRLLEALSEILQFEFPHSASLSQDVKEPDVIRKFSDQAEPLLVQLGGALRQWLARPDNVGARNEAMRVLQALESDARSAGAERFQEDCQQLTASIDQLGLQALQTTQIEPIFASYDVLKADLHQLRTDRG
jgi:chemosensory pili system protein ChpA (sensor histidine kinase/response regulator)